MTTSRELVEQYDPELLVMPEEYDDCIVGIVEGLIPHRQLLTTLL